MVFFGPSPNPADDYIHISITDEIISNGVIELSSANGVKVKTFEINDQHLFVLLSITDLSPGEYFITIVHDGRRWIQPFVKANLVR